MKILLLAWCFLVPNFLVGMYYVAGMPSANAHRWCDTYLKHYTQEEKAVLLHFLAQKKRVMQTYLFAQAKDYVNNPRICLLRSAEIQKKKLYDEYNFSAAWLEMTIIWSLKKELLSQSLSDIHAVVCTFPDRNSMSALPAREVNEGCMFLATLQKLMG